MSSESKMPTFKEELTAKALEVYEGLMSKHDKGTITNYELEHGLTTLNDAVGWAIDRKAAAFITEDRPKVDQSFRKRWLYVNAKGELLMVAMLDDMWGLEIFTGFDVTTAQWSKVKGFAFAEKTNPVKATFDKFKSIELFLRSRNYTEVTI